MTWGTAGNIITTNLDSATDSPADARPNLKAALDELTNVINGLNTAGGAAQLDSSTTKVIANNGVQATQNLVLTTGSGYSVQAVNLDLTGVLNLAPQTVAELNALSTKTEGDVAYCSNGDTGSKCLAVYDGSNWKIVALGNTIS